MGRRFFGRVGNPSVQVYIGGLPQANRPKMHGKKVLCDFGFAHMASRSYVAGHVPCSRAGLMSTPAQKMH